MCCACEAELAEIRRLIERQSDLLDAVLRRRRDRASLRCAAKPQESAVKAIQRAVASYYQVSLSSLQGRAKDAPTTHARQVSYVLIRELRGLSYPVIGRLLGRHHTAILAGEKKIRRQRRTDIDLRLELDELLNALAKFDANKRQGELFL